MKSLKTYNLDQDVIQILSRQPNKSRYVCNAIRRLYNNVDTVSPADFPTRQLLAALHARKDISAHLAGTILVELTTQV